MANCLSVHTISTTPPIEDLVQVLSVTSGVNWQLVWLLQAVMQMNHKDYLFLHLKNHKMRQVSNWHYGEGSVSDSYSWYK